MYSFWNRPIDKNIFELILKFCTEFEHDWVDGINLGCFPRPEFITKNVISAMAEAINPSHHPTITFNYDYNVYNEDKIELIQITPYKYPIGAIIVTNEYIRLFVKNILTDDYVLTVTLSITRNEWTNDIKLSIANVNGNPENIKYGNLTYTHDDVELIKRALKTFGFNDNEITNNLFELLEEL